MDRLTKEKRSWNMGRIRGADTKPEVIVRSRLHRMGFRFRLHQKNLPGKPDVVLAKYHTVIFVNGCYWHRHEGCRFAYVPKSRTDFWMKKFAENVERDKRVQQELTEIGWRVITIWECETSDLDELDERLRAAIQDGS